MSVEQRKGPFRDLKKVLKFENGSPESTARNEFISEEEGDIISQIIFPIISKIGGIVNTYLSK